VFSLRTGWLTPNSRKYEALYLGRGGRVQKTPTDNVPKYVDCGGHITFRTRQARPDWCGGPTPVSRFRASEMQTTIVS